MKLFTSLLLSLFLSLNLFAQYQVGQTSVDFIDADRGNRNVTSEVYYPANTAGTDVPLAAGEFPLVVFGHGFVIAHTEYQFLWEMLVDNGYIVAMLTTETSFSPSHGDFGEDMVFTINALLDESYDDTNSIFYDKIIERTAVMGHSMGGGASFLAAEQANIEAPITTQISFGAAETTPSAIGAAANMTIPALVMAGSLDCVAWTTDHQIPMFVALNNNPDYTAFIEITDASHCQFGNASGFSNCVLAEGIACGLSAANFITLEEQHTQMELAIIPWLDYFLKDDCDAMPIFQNHLMNGPHVWDDTNSLPTASATLYSDETTFCAGELLLVEAETEGVACDWSWQLDGNEISTEPYWVEVDMAGSLVLELTSLSGNVWTSTPIVITVNEPVVPTISAAGEVLTASSAMTYQWYFNGNLISGATSMTYTATESGSYTVETEDANGCEAVSNPEMITITGLEIPTWVSGITIKPNPFDTEILIDLPTSSSDFLVELFDAQGKRLNSFNINQSSTLSLAHLSTGLYILRLSNETGTYSTKLVKP